MLENLQACFNYFIKNPQTTFALPFLTNNKSVLARVDWLSYLAGNSQTAPTIFFKLPVYIFFNYFIKNPQTTIALPFLSDNISAIGGVSWKSNQEQ